MHHIDFKQLCEWKVIKLVPAIRIQLYYIMSEGLWIVFWVGVIDAYDMRE